MNVYHREKLNPIIYVGHKDTFTTIERFGQIFSPYLWPQNMEFLDRHTNSEYPLCDLWGYSITLNEIKRPLKLVNVISIFTRKGSFHGIPTFPPTLTVFDVATFKEYISSVMLFYFNYTTILVN